MGFQFPKAATEDQKATSRNTSVLLGGLAVLYDVFNAAGDARRRSRPRSKAKGHVACRHPHEVRDRIPLPDDDRAAFVALQAHAQRRPVAAGGGGNDRNAATQTRNAKQSFNSVAKEILPQAAEGMIL